MITFSLKKWFRLRTLFMTQYISKASWRILIRLNWFFTNVNKEIAHMMIFSSLKQANTRVFTKIASFIKIFNEDFKAVGNKVINKLRKTKESYGSLSTVTSRIKEDREHQSTIMISLIFLKFHYKNQNNFQ
jgi:hypothetical protein